MKKFIAAASALHVDMARSKSERNEVIGFVRQYFRELAILHLHDLLQIPPHRNNALAERVFRVRRYWITREF